MRKTCYNPVLVIIMAIALLFSAFLNFQRHAVEQANRTVEMAMEYESIARMAHGEGVPEEKVLKMFKERGVTSLVLFDTTLQKLGDKGKVTVVTGSELMHAYHTNQIQNGVWRDLILKGKVMTNAAYVTEGTSHLAMQDVEEDLVLRFGKDLVKVISESPKVIEVKGDTKLAAGDAYGEQKGILQMDLGLSSEELQLAKNLGFMVIARPINYGQGYNMASAPEREQIDAFFNRLDKSGAKISAFAGSGKTILGYKQNLEYVADNLLKRDITLAMVENIVQLQFVPLEGLVQMAELMDYKGARTYVIDKAEQKKLKVDEAVRRWALTDEERNIRINYVKTFLEPQDGKTLLQTNLDYVESITKSVEARNFSIGRAGVFSEYKPDRLLFIPIVFGIVAAGIIYFSQLIEINKKHQYLLLLIAGVLFCTIIIFTKGLLARQVLALTAATVMPVLSLNFILNIWDNYHGSGKGLKSVIIAATWQLALAITISLVGASFVGAILGDVRFLMEIDIYKGVKLTFILPILLMFILCVKRYSLFAGGDDCKNVIARIENFLARPITLKIVFAMIAFAFVAWVFIGRSGHTAGVPVPDIEVKLRLFLEEMMLARPREKEFLVGHPAFYLAAFAVYNKYPRLLSVAFILAATIGQGSLVQTFAHMRTPIIMSYIRAIDGYLLGAAIGICVLVAFAIFYPYLQVLKRRYLKNE
ncbi:MAG: DUF5693 family protein [Acidaminococcaceae bacterium]